MISPEVKQAISFAAVCLTFISYIPYYRDILRGKTHPHIYSWILWALLTILLVGLQITNGAGLAALVPAAAGLLCSGVVILSIKRGTRDITQADKTAAVLALFAMGFWLIIDQPTVSVLLVIAADVLAFIPTLRKSWFKPYSETLSLYITNAVRFSLSLLAVKEYTFVASIWFIVWAVINALYSVMLVLRRKQISAKN